MTSEVNILVATTICYIGAYEGYELLRYIEVGLFVYMTWERLQRMDA